jgi:hypothetical protein
VVLSWVVRNASNVGIDQGIGNFSASDQVSVRPDATTTYTLRASGPGGSVMEQVRVIVNTPAPPPPPPPVQQPLSGVFHCPNRPVPQHGQVVIDNLPDRKVQLHFDTNSWRALIFRQPNGTQRVVLISLTPWAQTHCEVTWETVN